MAMSPQMQAKYEECRLRMNKLNANFRTYMWIMIGLGTVMFVSSFMAGALSTLKSGQDGPWIFYHAMSAGIFQILMAIATIICGWMASAKLRIPSMVIMAVYIIGLIAIMFQKNGTFAAANIFFLLAGIGVNVWAQFLFGENDDLKSQPGYPLFSIEADTRAHYEVPLHVSARRAAASENMETVGAPAPDVQPVTSTAPVPETVSSRAADSGIFSDPKPLGPTPAVTLPPEVGISGAFGLDEMRQSADAAQNIRPEPVPVPQVELEVLSDHKTEPEHALPQVNAADMLADMRSIPSHATVQGNPDMLPTPEEVRARLAAMKKARSEHTEAES